MHKIPFPNFFLLLAFINGVSFNSKEDGYREGGIEKENVKLTPGISGALKSFRNSM